MLADQSGGVLRFPLRSPFARRAQRRERDPHKEFAFFRRRFTPRTVFMDIGAPDWELALQAASYVERVYAVDVSGYFLQNALVPCNLRLVLCDGVRIPVPDASVDVAFSGGFIDQLHPDDAREHLQSIRRSLVRGGEYACISRFPRQTRNRMLAAGFSSVRCYAGAVRLPWVFLSFIPQPLLRIAGYR